MPRHHLAIGALLALTLLLVGVPAAHAAVSVSRAELSSGELRVEGTGATPDATVTVTSPESMASTRAEGDGSYRLRAAGFTSSTCRVTVSDAATSTTATLASCTPTSSQPPSSDQPPPSTGSCTIVPESFANGHVGTLATWYFATTGCRTSKKPVQFSVVAGRLPSGTQLFTQGVASGGITGRPSTEGLFTFSIRVKDFTGATDTESFSITIDPPLPLVITNQSDSLSPGTTGEFYCCGNLFASGGVPDYTWELRSGQLPPGLALTASPGRITGTPTTTGHFVFLVRVTDARGAFAERSFSVTIS